MRGKINLLLLWSSACLFMEGCASDRHCCDEGGPVDPPLTKPLPYGPGFYSYTSKVVMDPASLAVAANHFIAMGEKHAVATLLAEDHADPGPKGHSDSRRRWWIARMLFESRHPEFIAPQRGWSDLTPKEIRAIIRDWPYMPLVRSQGIYFPGPSPFQDIVFSGVRESFPEYLRRCQTYGNFRNKEVKVPGRADAAAALKALVKQPKWNKLREDYRKRAERDFGREVSETPE